MMTPCKDCGVIDASCYAFCNCTKCVEPYRYEVWKNENKIDYELWLSRNS